MAVFLVLQSFNAVGWVTSSLYLCHLLPPSPKVMGGYVFVHIGM